MSCPRNLRIKLLISYDSVLGRPTRISLILFVKDATKVAVFFATDADSHRTERVCLKESRPISDYVRRLAVYKAARFGSVLLSTVTALRTSFLSPCNGKGRSSGKARQRAQGSETKLFIVSCSCAVLVHTVPLSTESLHVDVHLTELQAKHRLSASIGR
jgi:hypothetical protein